MVLMPAIQRGSISKDGRSVRYRDANGVQQRAGGFRNRTEAARWLRSKCEEVEALRRGDVIEQPKVEIPTLDQLCDEYLAAHSADPTTIRTLRERLKSVREKFGSTRVDRLTMPELRAFFVRECSEAYAPLQRRALKQVLNYGVRAKYIAENVAKAVTLNDPVTPEKPIFDSLADVRALANACEDRRDAALILFLGATNLRPEEAFALERSDVDRSAGTVSLTKRYSDGVLKQGTKGSKNGKRRQRTVPLSAAALEALDMLPARLDTRLLFPSRRGKYINIDNWRRRVWKVTIERTEYAGRGLTIYSLRHSWISWMIARGIPTLEVARLAGTSVKMIEEHYGHLVPDAYERARAMLDQMDAESKAAADGR
jgi:integrase